MGIMPVLFGHGNIIRSRAGCLRSRRDVGQLIDRILMRKLLGDHSRDILAHRSVGGGCDIRIHLRIGAGDIFLGERRGDLTVKISLQLFLRRRPLRRKGNAEQLCRYLRDLMPQTGLPLGELLPPHGLTQTL